MSRTVDATWAKTPRDVQKNHRDKPMIGGCVADRFP